MNDCLGLKECVSRPLPEPCICAELIERDGPVHRVGCVCERCAAAYERERRDPRDGGC